MDSNFNFNLQLFERHKGIKGEIIKIYDRVRKKEVEVAQFRTEAITSEDMAFLNEHRLAFVEIRADEDEENVIAVVCSRDDAKTLVLTAYEEMR